jgi:hypothetical protein
MTKKTVTVITMAGVLGLAIVGSIPALAQEPATPATEPGETCPYHDATNMPHDGMEEWMDSADHATMHDEMDSMMGSGSMMGNGSMMGSGMGSGSTMGNGSMMGSGMGSGSMTGNGSMMDGSTMGNGSMGSGSMMGGNGG